MAKAQSRYVCQSCGAATQKWSGRCDSCGEWNSIVEETPLSDIPRGMKSGGGAQGVGRATTNAVVSASILILAANYLITELLFTQ